MDLLLATARENPFGIPVLLVLIGLTLALFEHDRRMKEKHPVSGWGGTSSDSRSWDEKRADERQLQVDQLTERLDELERKPPSRRTGHTRGAVRRP
jgi:hypothetical protein